MGLYTTAQTPGQIDPNAAGMMDNVENMQKDMARFKGLKPLTSEQLKEWLPETLGELERIKFSVGDGNTGMLTLLGLTIRQISLNSYVGVMKSIRRTKHW